MTSPTAVSATTPMSMGSFAISASLPLSGTMVAMMESTSSMAGMASMTVRSLPSNGARNTRGRSASCLRSCSMAGNIGM